MKRKHSGLGALGLGGYASDEGGSEAGSDAEEGAAAGPGAAGEDRRPTDAAALLPHYRSRESLDLDEEESADEAAAAAAAAREAAEASEQRRRSPSAAEASGASTDGDTGGGSGSRGAAPEDPLSRLPPELREPLPTSCPEALQAKFRQYLHALHSKGISLTDQIVHRKAFRNPDFLAKLVDHFRVDPHGSAFAPDVFQPAALPQEDTIDGLMRALEREQERRARLREQQSAAGAARIEFARGAGALGAIPASGSASNLAAAQAAALAQAAVARVVGSKR